MAFTTSPCPDDLNALVSRGTQLSDLQRQRLATHLRSCAECAVTALAIGDFHAIGRPEPDDAQRMARAIRAALRRERTGRRWLVAAAASLVLVCAGAAVARILYHGPVAPRSRTQLGRAAAVPPSSPTSASPPPKPLVREPPPAQPKRHPQTQTAAKAIAFVPLGTKAAPTDELPRSHPAEPASAAVSPASLLRQAAQARAAGDLIRAIAILERLEREYPSSAEATAAWVSLGRLRLTSGALPLAGAAFARYLSIAPDGALAEDALEGAAETRQRLGAGAEERALRAELLRRFPSSPYAARSRERLRELAR